MAIHVDNMSVIECPWHDADVHSLKVNWSDNDGVSVVLRCEINPEEDKQILVDLGIKTSTVDVHFQDVWQLKTNIIGVNSQRELVDDWKIILASPIISEIRSNSMAKNVGLIHHQIRCIGGSTLDIVFTRMLLDEV